MGLMCLLSTSKVECLLCGNDPVLNGDPEKLLSLALRQISIFKG